MTPDHPGVLIVDDDVDLLASLGEAFADEGYRVETAVNGRDALEKLSSIERPHVVILDLIMPVMNGNELYAAMKGDDRFRDIPVLVSTSDPSHSPAGVPVMKKPVNLDALFDAVRRLC